VDPAGFEAHKKKQTKNTRLDETAIAVVKVGEYGWWVADIIHGRWTLDETVDKIFAAVNKYKPMKVGIERGIAQQAILSPLQDRMRRYGRFFRIELLTHGNKSKTDRVMWALQGRFQHGHIKLNPGDYTLPLLDQLFQFPSKLTHDDLLDALAYIDQIAIENYAEDDLEEEEWADVDVVAGY
jgi:predicted phage terminase large subunit-like protein